jgi:hypothetical protein
MYTLPQSAAAARRDFSEETKSDFLQPTRAWGFPEKLIEMCIRSERYDQEITLLHFEGKVPAFFDDGPGLEDTYDRFVNNGQMPAVPLRR